MIARHRAIEKERDREAGRETERKEQASSSFSQRAFAQYSNDRWSISEQ